MKLKTIIHIILLLGFASCIKPYEPELKNVSVHKYVVSGMVSSQQGFQDVYVSISSSVNEPQYIPVNSCQVEIIDDVGQKFALSAYGNGKYRVWMDAEYLVPGRSYKVVVIMPDGVKLESSFDKMPEGPEVDDVYFEIEELPTNDPEVYLNGIQIYTNLQAKESDSRYYRWQLIETWEYHSDHPKEFYYDGVLHHVQPVDSSQFYCWNTKNVDNIFTLSTVNLTENSYQKFPLNYVLNTTARLAILYSLFINQTALSQDAYIYWDKLRENSSQDGGLYSTQPMAIKGNMKNITNPQFEVLGYFQASSVTSKRIFIEPVEDLELDFSNRCYPMILEQGYQEIEYWHFPAYIMSNDGSPTGVWLNDECVECTLRGGTTQKPYYWPTK